MDPRYVLRAATLDDIDTLVAHRIAMFTDMGVRIDAVALEATIRRWFVDSVRSGVYHAWLVESDAQPAQVVAGAGLTVIPWPPGPTSLSSRVGFVYNVYVHPAHRRRGLARRLMDTLHAWCRAEGVMAVALNASQEARHLYDSMGYVEAPSPMLWHVFPQAGGLA